MAPLAAKTSLLQCKSATRVAQSALVARKVAMPCRARHVIARSALETAENSVKAEKKDKKKRDEEEEWEGDDALSPQQVEDFLTILCEETNIAEVELKMGGFKMKVRRSLSGLTSTAAATAAPAPAPAAAAPAPVAAAPAPVSATPTMTLSDSEDEDDGSVINVTAPKVGILRRGRYIKGKRVGKGDVAEIGDKVKKGQVLCFVEQLGTHVPVEAPQAGEIADFVCEDGDPVAYGDVVVEIAPFFGGHIIGDSKYA